MKYKIWFQNPSTTHRENEFIVLEKHEYDDFQSDMNAAKHSDPVEFKGLGMLPKSSWKGTEKIGSEISDDKEIVKYISHNGIKEKVTMKRKDGEWDCEYEQIGTYPAKKMVQDQKWYEDEHERLTERRKITGIPDPRIPEYRDKITQFKKTQK